MTSESKIASACVTAFFPHHQAEMLAIITQGAFGSAVIAKIMKTSDCHEAKARLFHDTCTWLIGSFKYWVEGMQIDVLNEFPAARLIKVIHEPESIDWPDIWVSKGGSIFDGQMVALKLAPIWRQISAFNLPFPPFHLGSHWDIEDVDRTDAKSFGIKLPEHYCAAPFLEIEERDLSRRITAALASQAIDAPPQFPSSSAAAAHPTS